LRAKILASLHGVETFAGDRFFSRCVDSMYSVSESASQKLSERYEKQCLVLPNFLNGEKFKPWERPVPPQIKRIVSVGRFVEMKGMMNLLQVFSKVRSSMPDVRLTLIGDGPEKPRLESWIREHHLESAVELPGIQDEDQVLNHLRSAWVYVQPSIGDESFSISTLEAFAMGLSVIASDRVHVANEFRNENGAEIYESHDMEALGKLLSQVISENWETVQSRGCRARRFVEQKFFSDQIVPQIEELCRGRRT
jgi:glycosyltransferase involved in cell wall biosynthesis